MIPSGTVSTILSHKGNAICTISPEATVFKAIQMMADKNVATVIIRTTQATPFPA